MDAFCWIDIETTGLDPSRDLILEIAFKITDLRFSELYTQHFWVNDPNGKAVTSIMDRFVYDMHTKSGLLDEAFNTPVERFYGANVNQLDIDFSSHLSFVKNQYEIDKLYPAGSSVHFDISFLRASGLELTLKELSHRHFDVTSLKLFMLSQNGFYPEIPPIEPEHRALSDIESSINFARQFVLPVAEASVRAEHAAKIVAARLDD